ncbi:hypothetical protein Tco_1218181 [Tanacetum coccineum]
MGYEERGSPPKIPGCENDESLKGLKTSGSKKGVLMSKRAVTIHGFSESLLRGQTRGILATSADEVIRRSCSRSSVIDYGRVLPQSDGSLNGVGQRSVRDAITAGGQCSNNVGEKQISFGESVQVFDQGPLRKLRFVGKGTSSPSGFAIYEAEAPSSNLINRDNYAGRRIKQSNIEFLDNFKAGGIQIRHRRDLYLTSICMLIVSNIEIKPVTTFYMQ